MAYEGSFQEGPCLSTALCKGVRSAIEYAEIRRTSLGNVNMSLLEKC